MRSGVKFGMPNEEADRMANVAALSVLHLTAVVDLLRGHDRIEQARRLEAVVADVGRILADELGQARLTAALDTASDLLWRAERPNGWGRFDS